MKEKKPRRQPFEIDEKAIARLGKRVDEIMKHRTLVAIARNHTASAFSDIGDAAATARGALTEVLDYLKLTGNDIPPDDTDE